MSAERTDSAAPPRNPIIAGVLGLVWPGIGYLYAGRGRPGLLLLLLLPIVEFTVAVLAVLIPVAFVCVVIPAALILALHLLCARGAARAARDFPAGRPVPWFSRWYSCVAAVILAAGPNLLWASAYRNTFVQAFKIPSGGMEPTVLIGDRLLVVKWAYGWRDPLFGRLLSEPGRPGRGELLVFRYPPDRSRAFLKRCIGLPGDTVEIRGTVVLVGGRPLNEPYAKFLSLPTPDLAVGQDDQRGTWGPQTVPPDSYFVLGDNRDNSKDSRFWGFVPQDDLLGRPAIIYWSYAATREEYMRTRLSDSLRDAVSALGRTRWERIGRRLE